MKPEAYFERYGEEMCEVPALVRGGQFCSRHGRTLAALAVITLAIFAGMSLAGNAIAMPLPGVGIDHPALTTPSDGTGGDLFGLSAPLRGAVNFLLWIMQLFLQATMDCDLLTLPLEEVWQESGTWGTNPETHAANGSVLEVIVGIQHFAVMPIAYIVLICVFTMGLVKLMSNAGWNEGGIDLYKMLVLFVMLGIGKALIDNSVEILCWVYDLCRELINAVQDWAQASGAVTIEPVPDSVTDVGMLLGMLLMSLLLVLAVVASSVVINMSVIFRTIQVLLFVWAAPLPLAFFISDEGRGIATGFLERFVGVVLSGAVLILLFVIFTVLLSSAVNSYQSQPANGDIGAWFMSLMGLLPIVLCYAYMCFKSGELAQQIIGQ